MSRKAICWWTLDGLARTLFLWLELANTKPQLYQIFLSLHKAGFICNPSPLLLEGKGQEIKGYFLLGRSCKKNLIVSHRRAPFIITTPNNELAVQSCFKFKWKDYWTSPKYSKLPISFKSQLFSKSPHMFL